MKKEAKQKKQTKQEPQASPLEKKTPKPETKAFYPKHNPENVR